MPETDQVADQLKEELIAEFLRKNPGVSRSQVTSKMSNGRIVIDTLDNVFSEFSGRNFLRMKEQEKEFIKKQLAVSDDQRYESCQNSYKSCKKIIHYFFSSPNYPFGITEKNEQNNYLKRHEKISVDRSHAVHQVRQEFTEMMAGSMSPAQNRVKDLTTRYYKAFLDQLKAQYAIYKREHELGSNFNTFVINFMKEHMPSARSKVKPKSLKAIAQAFIIMKRDQTPTKEPKELDRETLEVAVTEMDGYLEERRSHFEKIQIVIQYIEKIVAALEEEKSTLEAAEPEKKEGKRRMAFALKLFGR